ncbi:MAG: hypothetical protein Q8L15_19805 [Methylobacter sp.]|nr:hypothetical protein [Methylobacter sp.]
MNDPKSVSKFQVIQKSLLWASYETLLAILPILVWGFTLFSIGQDGQLRELPAWSFLSVSIFVTILRDGLKAFHRETVKQDKLDQHITVSFSLIGVVLSSVLLVLSVLHSQKLIPFLEPFFYEAVLALIGTGLIFLFIVKFILVQRAEYGHYI